MRTLQQLKWLISIFLLSVFTMSSVAIAKSQKKKVKQSQETEEAKQAEVEFNQFLQDLKSNDPEKVMMSVQMLGAFGNPQAAQPLIDLLKTGPRSDITNVVIETLGMLGNPIAIPTLLAYLNHRRFDARISAIFALENYIHPDIKPALEQKLRDSDAQVRSTAALVLGTKGDESSVAILFKAFDRGVHDAVVSIGKLGTAKDAALLTTYLGKLNIGVLLPGFYEFILRPTVNETTKLGILNSLYELAGPEVRRFAIKIRATLEAKQLIQTEKVNALLGQMIRQIADN